MATSTQYLPWDNSTLTNFKAWSQGIGTALAAFGWTKSATPTGTVNWSTIPYTPWTAGSNFSGGNQYVPGGNVGTINFANAWSNGLILTLTAAATSNGTTTVYTGTITGGAANALAGTRFTVTGFANGGNNITAAIATASTTTTLTLINANGVAETHAGTATLTYSIGDLVTNNNATWYCNAAYTPTTSSPAPPYEGLTGASFHWALYVFEVWQSAGATPIYLRFTYCGGGPGASISNENVIPRIKVAVGTTVDVSGNLGTGTGNASAEADLNFTVNPALQWTPGSTFPCFFSGDSTNRFAMLMWPDLYTQLGPNGSSFFCIERSLSNTGSYYTTQSGPAFVQGASDTYIHGTSPVTKAYPSNNTAGNLLVVFASNVGTSTSGISITDTNVNTWIPFFTPANLSVNGQAQIGWYAFANTTGPNTVTVAWTTGSTIAALAIGEWTGVNAIDQLSTLKTGASPWSTNSITTTQANELFITIAVNSSGTINSSLVNTTPREFTSLTGTNYGLIGDFPLYATGTYSSSGGGSGNYAAVAASFKATVNTPPVTPYWTVIWWGSFSSNSGQGFMGSFIQTGPSTWITTQFDSRIWTVSATFTHQQPPNPITEYYASGNGNQSIPAFPIWPLVGWVGNPMTAVLTTKNADAPAMGSFTALLYGTTHTYLNVRNNGAFQTFGNVAANGAQPNGLAMRFD
jgi:hypothetical protein